MSNDLIDEWVGRTQDEDHVQRFYIALKAKMTGQVINGVLKGCILEHELEEVYEEFRKDNS